jgi:hypothetical protein
MAHVMVKKKRNVKGSLEDVHDEIVMLVVLCLYQINTP